MGKIVAANWKMNLRRQSACELASALKDDGRDCWLFAAFPHLALVHDALIGSAIKLGAQDVSPEEDGAFTGDVSAEMLADAGCTLVLVGHSERRHGHGEQGAALLLKLKRALRADLKPSYCVGETLAERKAGKAQEVVTNQLATLIELAAPDRNELSAVAYEPVWAIGTGETATPEQAAEMHAFIRTELTKHGLKELPILYGGSVKPDNARDLMTQPNVDGVLVGGASLEIESLRAIDDVAREM
ncbi:MAG: triose-phosphate isomerase [Planctomycetes bacterium]|nr:triose-phosphate isomerase [Planctomycetota bacterium]